MKISGTLILNISIFSHFLWTIFLIITRVVKILENHILDLTSKINVFSRVTFKEILIRYYFQSPGTNLELYVFISSIVKTIMYTNKILLNFDEIAV